jgi:hypothetical protein
VANGINTLLSFIEKYNMHLNQLFKKYHLFLQETFIIANFPFSIHLNILKTMLQSSLH